jgi:tRNA modification GTPase
MLDPSTILAIASPPGAAPRGLLRVSGESAFDLLDAALLEPCPRRRGAFFVRLRSTPEIGGELPATLLLMPGPRSFTGEDVAELSMPGNPVLLRAVEMALLAAAERSGFAVRRASPGEFTARAFLRGRLDLAQAEGIAASIAAASDAELAAAASLRDGRLSREGLAAADALSSLLARLEAGIDFADEEDVVSIEASVLDAALGSLEASLERLAASREGLEAIGEAPRIVLVGPPNAGKSALFNALLGRERTVVSPIAGTTRDAIAEPLRIASDRGAFDVLLVDLAGLGDAIDALDEMAQARSRREIAEATVRLRCHPADGGEPPPAAEGEIVVVTKGDLLAGRSGSEGGAIVTSAIDRRGLQALREAIAQRLGEQGSLRMLAAAAARHRTALVEASARVVEARALLAGAAPGEGAAEPELVAASLRGAIEALESIAGRFEPDEVLGRIFASFCIGK